ncbi:hypothetical protein [Mycobacterium sp. AZCC_0083]|uniref:hypothetical protein n=1 Tax=Mycobacterium sp. AZCC_0083 TaxID=2735882 RepID=UPI00161F4AE9|nr:hypothetical protein [Mycobacterium sp. AZCC_0083]MBB5167196.1 hypothetical protein [Mycobacterium sp. AZCC_0083]
MADPTFFQIDGPILVPGDDGADAGPYPDLVAPTSGLVIFKYNLAPGELFRFGETVPPAAVISSKEVVAVIQPDGSFLRQKDDGTVGGPVYLLANTPALGIAGDLSIYVRYKNIHIPGTTRPVALNPFYFNSPTVGGLKRFAELIPVPAAPVTGVTQGLTGISFTGEGHVNLDGTVQFELNNGTETVPLALNYLSMGGIDGGTPSDPGIGLLEGGSP